MNAPTRREAIVTIAASAAARGVAAEDSPPRSLSDVEIRRLAALVDTIIPPTETPGAGEAGVADMIDEDADANAELLAWLQGFLERAEGFEDLDADGRAAWMTELMNAPAERGRDFERLKGLTIDRYYQTEIGLVNELGYQGNSYLAEFPGCVHDHLVEEQA